MTLPLSGKTVLVTRAPGQAGELSELLRRRGAEVAEVPTIEIVPPASWEEADRAIERLPDYDWVILTSPNAVRWFLERVRERRGDLAALAPLRICAVGPKTKARLETEGLEVAFVPKTYRAEALVEEAGEEAWRGKRILFPRAAEGRDVIPAAMRGLDAELDLVAVYRTVPSPAGGERVRALLDAGGLDAVTFASGSAVRNFVALLGPGDLARIPGRVLVACIGPVTEADARAAGLPVDAVAAEATLPALVEALERLFSPEAPS